ncbi:hypothetical protein G3480_22560, partial [Thiorhodococcus mannitoliphagus]|nr:hypothetical protein [Thiorhodococcus mannitoliphagus]
MTPTDLQGEAQAGHEETLRQRAERIAADAAAQSPQAMAALSPEDLQRLVHELRVHQIQLELQNECGLALMWLLGIACKPLMHLRKRIMA